MTTISHRERIARSVLLVSAALVTAMVLGIGYQQQAMRGSLSASAVMPLEEEFSLQEPLPLFVDTGDGETADEPLVWCCTSDAGLCFEQLAAEGCPDNGPEYSDLDSCISVCE